MVVDNSCDGRKDTYKTNKERFQWYATSHMCHGIDVLVIVETLGSSWSTHNQLEY